MLLDRDVEKQKLDALLAAVRDGLTGVLVFRGEAGIGKTALLEYAVGSARDMQVARVVGVESEMELGFSGLHQLLVPFLERLGQLPVPQFDALGAAFGLVEGPPSDLFLVGLAALTLLADAAVRRPVLCVVDDAQWLDQASAVALGFVARRLFVDRIGMLFAVREPSERPVTFEGLCDVTLAGLPDVQAWELLASVAAGLDQPVGDRIISETRGNPLALVELGGELTDEQLAGISPLPEPLPLGRRLEERFLSRVRRLPEEAQTLLLVAAADPSGDPALLWRAAARLGLGRDAAEAAEVDRLLELTPSVAFHHPLIRSAVYHGASSLARRQAHEALAAASDPDGDADRRAWHLAAATTTANEEIALQLEGSAIRAQARGGYAAAAKFLERAADLTPDADRRAGRLLAVVQAELTAGSAISAQARLREVGLRKGDAAQHAEALRLQGAIHVAVGRAADGFEVLLAAARAREDIEPIASRDVYLEAIEAAVYAGRSARLRIAEAMTTCQRPAPSTAAGFLIEGYLKRFSGDYNAAATLFRRATADLLEDETGVRWMFLGCLAAADLWDIDLWRALCARSVRVARETGALRSLPYALALLAGAEFRSGRLRVCVALGEEATEISAATTGILPEGDQDAALLVWTGPETAARAAIDAQIRQLLSRGCGTGFADHCRAVLELGLGNYDAALAAALTACDDTSPMTHHDALPDIVEAAVRTGDAGAAACALTVLSEHAQASGTPLALGVLARSAALLAPDEDADRLYSEAIEHLQGSPAVPELARTHLLYGEWLRRQRRRRDAREELRTAHEMLDRFGAELFAQRARHELRATGERVRTRGVETRDELTPQEARIAHLASEGASNAEIGAQLFISASTVAYHLRKAFRKLGVGTRSQLDRAMAEQRSPEIVVRGTPRLP
jgi:DNA-binding CsgD family transcriptional regulator